MKNYNKFNPLPAELRKLGLDKKEASIYLLLLEKRADTVINIAGQTALSRPTVYRTLQNLINKELVTKEENKKRSFYTANSPESFLNILKINRRKAEEQEREFLRIISALQRRYYSQTNKKEIKTYQTKAALEDFSNTDQKTIRALCFNKESQLCIKIGQIYPKIKKRLGKITIKEISSGPLTGSSSEYLQHKVFSSALNGKIDAAIIIDKILVFEKKQVLCIEEKSLVDFVKIVFDMLWSSQKA